jgi:hypothetical protein
VSAPPWSVCSSFIMEEVQVRGTVAAVATIWLSLAKKKHAELLAALNNVREESLTLQQLMDELPVQWIQQVDAIENVEKMAKETRVAAERKQKKDQRKAEKEGAKVVAKKKNAEVVRVEKKRAHEESLGFASFYARIKVSMLEARDHGALEMSLFKNGDELVLGNALAKAQLSNNAEDYDVVCIKDYIQTALLAQKGLNSLAFVQVAVIGSRFFDLFQYHQQHKDSSRFISKGWTNYSDYLKVVAPGVSARKERNYRRTFELTEVFPCVKLISDCSIDEFWLHMRKFRDLLKEDDSEACQWRYPVSNDNVEKDLDFSRKLTFTTMDGDSMLPFAECEVFGVEQEEECFIEQKDQMLAKWQENDAKPKKQKTRRNADCDEDSFVEMDEHNFDGEADFDPEEEEPEESEEDMDDEDD